MCEYVDDADCDVVALRLLDWLLVTERDRERVRVPDREAAPEGESDALGEVVSDAVSELVADAVTDSEGDVDVVRLRDNDTLRDTDRDPDTVTEVVRVTVRVADGDRVGEGDVGKSISHTTASFVPVEAVYMPDVVALNEEVDDAMATPFLTVDLKQHSRGAGDSVRRQKD